MVVGFSATSDEFPLRYLRWWLLGRPLWRRAPIQSPSRIKLLKEKDGRGRGRRRGSGGDFSPAPCQYDPALGCRTSVLENDILPERSMIQGTPGIRVCDIHHWGEVRGELIVNYMVSRGVMGGSVCMVTVRSKSAHLCLWKKKSKPHINDSGCKKTKKENLRTVWHLGCSVGGSESQK